MRMPLKLFLAGWRQVRRDGMLLALIPAPILMGAVLRFGLPAAGDMLARSRGLTLRPWYDLGDSLLVILTPIFPLMVSAFLILDERDEGTGAYYSVTPACGGAYLSARLGLPALWGFISTALIVRAFGLAVGSRPEMVGAALASTLEAVTACMLVVALAANKVEGLALSKLTNLFILGLPAAWFLQAPHKYLFSLLPSFWIGEGLLAAAAGGTGVVHILAGIAFALGWMTALTRLFLRRAW
ncbi:MAG: hypothetical protein AB1492_08360 [Bacillota bacterium]